MTFIIGLVITLGALLGGFAAMGGHLMVLWQPWEYVVICGSSIGTFFVANSMKVVKDTGKGCIEAIKESKPKPQDYLDLLSMLFSLMREMRSKSKSEMEVHFDTPQDSEIFKAYPKILANKVLTNFICDYFRLMVIGNARTHEIEALMDEEIQTISGDKMKAYSALQAVSDGLPALGIVAAVLGVIKAMGALDQSPEVLGHYIGAALVGTFAGIFFSYGLAGPLATKIKSIRQKQMRMFVIVKQTMLAFMNGAMPAIALEFGRKTISEYERPSINDVEQSTSGGGEPAKKAA